MFRGGHVPSHRDSGGGRSGRGGRTVTAPLSPSPESRLVAEEESGIRTSVVACSVENPGTPPTRLGWSKAGVIVV